MDMAMWAWLWFSEILEVWKGGENQQIFFYYYHILLSHGISASNCLKKRVFKNDSAMHVYGKIFEQFQTWVSY